MSMSPMAENPTGASRSTAWSSLVSWMQANFRVTGLEQIGKRQVIGFWKAHRDMAPATAYAYWLAIKVLWQWLGRAEDPPSPRGNEASVVAGM
jgi:hypothetical protein